MKISSKYLMAFVIIFSVLLWITGLFFFANDTSNLTSPENLTPHDAIVVLTGGSNRIDTGFDLLEKGISKKLFISGVYRGVDAAQLLKRWKNEPNRNLDCCVVLGFQAENTVENAAETIEWLKNEKFESFYLVTANYHMKRALLEFHRSSPNYKITPFPIVPKKVDVQVWWKDKMTRNLIIKEYTKYILVYLIHNILN